MIFFIIRVGYAGEDFPKSEVPAWVGTSPDTTAEDPNAMDTGRKHLILNAYM